MPETPPGSRLATLVILSVAWSYVTESLHLPSTTFQNAMLPPAKSPASLSAVLPITPECPSATEGSTAFTAPASSLPASSMESPKSHTTS